MQQATATQSHQKQTSNFHDKYGNAVLASEAAFCVAVCAYTAMQTEQNGSCSLLAASPQRNGEISNHPSRYNIERFQNKFITDAK